VRAARRDKIKDMVRMSRLLFSLMPPRGAAYIIFRLFSVREAPARYARKVTRVLSARGAQRMPARSVMPKAREVRRRMRRRAGSITPPAFMIAGSSAQAAAATSSCCAATTIMRAATMLRRAAAIIFRRAALFSAYGACCAGDAALTRAMASRAALTLTLPRHTRFATPPSYHDAQDAYG